MFARHTAPTKEGPNTTTPLPTISPTSRTERAKKGLSTNVADEENARLEIEQKSLEKRHKAGQITQEEQVRLQEIKALLKAPAGPASVGDPRGEMLAAINARRED